MLKKIRARFNLLRLSLPERRSTGARFMALPQSRVRFLRSVAPWSSSRRRSKPLRRSIPLRRSRPSLLSDLRSCGNLLCRFECCPLRGRCGLFIIKIRAKAAYTAFQIFIPDRKCKSRVLAGGHQGNADNGLVLINSSGGALTNPDRDIRIVPVYKLSAIFMQNMRQN